MEARKIYYKVNGYACSIETCISWDDEDLSRNDDIADDCAKDYYDDKDGWEDKWPLTFELSANEDFSDSVKFTVYLEFDPTFSSTHES